VVSLLPRLRDVDVQRLSGGRFTAAEVAVAGQEEVRVKAAPAPVAVKAKADDAAVDAARQRFLERKRKAVGQGR
jgi:hypothetical protein